MSNASIVRTLGFIDEAIASEELITNNNSLMKMVRTMATFSPQVSISSAVALTGGAIADVFTIAGGYIIVEGLFVFVTAAVSANACTLAWGFDPTTGAADIPIASGVDIQSLAVGDMVWVEGDASAAVVADQATNAALMCITPMLGPPGGIDLDLQNSDPTTGAADIVLVWRACSPAAYVTVA